MARRFLYFIAFCTFLVIAGAFAYRLYGPQLMRAAMVPSVPVAPLPAMASNAWDNPALWLARPDRTPSPADWRPSGVAPSAEPRRAAIFFVHPTSYLDRRGWNAPLDDAAANQLAATMTGSMAGALADTGAVWAPRYRQATIGSFLTTGPEGRVAVDQAYRDVEAAFDAFLRAIPGDQPIILAGHSQGARHLLALMTRRVAGQPLARRIAAVYVIGWPISIAADLPALGLPACQKAGQSGCILSWLSFAEPADPSEMLAYFEREPGLTGAPRTGSPVVCTNPLTGAAGGSAPASANLGRLLPSLDFRSATLDRAGVSGARCDAKGLLMIGAPPEGYKAFVLPGNNYHVFDYALFWANIRADVAARLANFK